MITVARFLSYTSAFIVILSGVIHYYLEKQGSVFQRMSYPFANMLTNIILKVLIERDSSWTKKHFALIQSFILMAILIESNLFQFPETF